MYYLKVVSISLFLFLFSNFCVAQITIADKDYELNYSNQKIEVNFYPKNNEITNFQISDAFTNQIVNYTKTGNTFNIDNPETAQILKVNYNLDNEIVTNYIATKSNSTGNIKVFFNHPVDISFAQTQNAINLSNTLDDKLIQYINSCQSTLDIAIYNSYSPSASTGIAGAINAAFARGVQVRLIYDGSTSSVMIPLINASIPKVASPQGINYGIMHNKFVIFDANNIDPNKPLVWTGSTNWTIAQIDGPDKNSAIIIQDQALALGYKIEFEEMWGSNNQVPNSTISKFGQFKSDNTPHNYIIGGKQIENYFSPSDGTTAKIINVINSANSDMEIATMLETRTDIETSIINKFNSGISNISLIVDSQNPSGNQFPALQSGLSANHAKVSTLSGIMHHKFVVIDNFNAASDPQVLLGSHNWSNSAETKNDENTLVVHDANITNQYFQAFAYLYLQSGGVFSPNLATENNTFQNSEINIFPNPTTGIININNYSKNNNDNTVINLTDMLGRNILYKSNTIEANNTIDLSNQQNGIYFLQIKNESKISNFKIIKQ